MMWRDTDLSVALASFGFSDAAVALAVNRALFRLSAFILFLSMRALWLSEDGRIAILMES